MRVLGIDPGSESLGWGVVASEGSKYALTGCGAVRSRSKDPFELRLANVYAKLSDIIDEFEPTTLAIEEAFYAANASVAIKLGQVRGVVLLLAAQRGLEIGEYAPRLVKKAVVGYGAAEKRQVGEMVKLLLGLKAVPAPHDVADALAIAICHIHHAGFKLKTRGR